jgi:hypothetical protein
MKMKMVLIRVALFSCFLLNFAGECYGRFSLINISLVGDNQHTFKFKIKCALKKTVVYKIKVVFCGALYKMHMRSSISAFAY